jgi:hypothetical protein
MDETLKAFKNMSDLTPKEISSVLTAPAKKLRDSARNNVRPHSNTVAQAFDFITKNDGKYPNTKLLGIKGGNTRGTKTITAPALAVILEFGTVERFTKDGSSRGHVAPVSWLRRAIDTNKQSVSDDIKKGLIGIIDKKAKINKLK